jgi:hypothetical protein
MVETRSEGRTPNLLWKILFWFNSIQPSCNTDSQIMKSLVCTKGVLHKNVLLHLLFCARVDLSIPLRDQILTWPSSPVVTRAVPS